MKLPHPLLDSQFFVFTRAEELLRALKGEVSEDELSEISRLSDQKLPPVASEMALATMLGVNPGLIRSFLVSTNKHYGTFRIDKGKGKRTIHAPKVALKMVQKWLAIQLAGFFDPPAHVYGFVAGRSHIGAATVHAGAEWVLSVDIENFFPSTPRLTVEAALQSLGYSMKSAKLIGGLTCYQDVLAQGAPSSPVLSNMCMRDVDRVLQELADRYGSRVTRYADDIVFSGVGAMPDALLQDLRGLFEETPWTLSDQKTEVVRLPNRLKVHGLLVHGENVRLTKGYRNRLRAYNHLIRNDKVADEDINRVRGHLNYEKQVLNAGS